MMNFYNSEDVGNNFDSNFETSNEDGFTSAFASFFGNFKCIALIMLMIMTFGQLSWAQSTANYTFATNITSSLALDINANAIDMTAGTTQLVGPGLDAAASPVTPIGFSFPFMGSFYTQFSISEDGLMQFGGTAVPVNTYTITGGTATAPRLGAFNSDMRTGTTTGKIHYKLVGTAPNRTLIIELKDMTLFYTGTASAGNSTFQMRLYETTGNIEYVYGTMNVTLGLPASGTSIGFYTGAAANSFASVNFLTSTYTTTGTYTANTTPAVTGAVTNLNSATNGSRRAYTFYPNYSGNTNAPITFTSTTSSSTSTLNWIDDSINEGYFSIGRSTSPTGPFTVVGTVASTTALTTGTPYSYTSTGLNALTQYYYEIKALNETGGTSSALTGSQTTSAILTYVWNATTGSASWVTPASWTPARTVTDALDVLQFSNGGNSTATNIPTQTVGKIEFSNNTIASFQAAVTSNLTTNKLVITTGSTLLSDGNVAALALTFSAGAVNPIDGRLEIINTGFANTINFANSVTTISTGGTLAAGGILAGAITGSAATLLMNGTYEHKYTTVSGTIPTALWSSTSNTNIIGYTTNANATGGFTQNFNNFTWNCPLQTGNINLSSSGVTGIAGTFTVANTNTGSLRWTGTGSYTVNANNFTQSGGIFDLATGTSGAGMTFNVSGTFTKTAGTFQSGGTATSNPTLNFNGTALQSVNFDAQPTGPITYRVSNPIGITLNGSFGTSFALGNGTLGGLRVSTTSIAPVTFAGTLTNFVYNAVNSRLTYDATGSMTATAQEFPATAGPANLTIGLSLGSAVTLPFSRSLACATANSVLTMTSGNIDLGANSLTLGASAAFPGTMSYTAGGIKTSTGSFIRWFPATGLPTSAGTGNGFYPLISGSNNRAASVFFSTSTALSAGGTIGLNHASSGGLSPVSPPILDGAFSVDTKTNSSWNITTGNGITATGTLGLRLTGAGALTTSTVANLRVIQATTALGTHVAGSGTNPNFQANRTGLSLADIASTHYIGAGVADITAIYNSIASGNWNNPTTWDTGTVPTCTDIVNISTGNNVTVNSAANNAKTITIGSGGTLTMASGDLLVGCTLFNNPLNNNGTLVVNGGTLTVNGNILNAITSTFTQSGGDIIIDGNNGVVAESVATGNSLLNFLNNTVTLSGGKITIVDPHLASTATSNFAVVLNFNVAATNTLTTSPNHTFQFGDGISTQAGGTGGFSIDNWTTTTYLAFGKLVVKGPTGTNRIVNSRYNFTANGDIVVENGGIINFGVPLYFGGNIDVQTGGTFTNTGVTNTGVISSNTGSTLTAVPVTIPQTITNNGTLGNLLTASTANFASLNINNTNTTGVTLNSPISTVALGLTVGLVNSTNTNLLTLGTATAAGTLTGGSATSFVNGPLARTIANANANTAYNIFPVGKGTVYSPISLAPTTTSVAVFKAETFNTNTGTADVSITGLSAAKRWEAISTTGTYTDINVRLGDNAITATSIPVQAPTATGLYTQSFGSLATYVAGTPNTTTSNTALPIANYTGFLSYAVNNLCLGTPAPGATTATANALCSGQSTTLGVTNASSGVGLTYQWQSSTDNVTYTNIASANSSTYTVTPTVNTYYQVIVTCATGPATATSTPLQITFANSITATTPGSVCGQGTVSLAATGSAGTILNWYATPTSTASLGTGSPFVTPSITATATYYVAASSNVIGTGTMQIGTATTATTATEQPTAFCNRWPSYLSQTIYTAAELTAQGLLAGNITSMAYNILTLGDGATNANFNVKIGTTAGANFANTTLLDTSAYTNVYGPSTYTHTATGLQTINFTTPFVWDGTSNIVVNVSMSGADSINNSQTLYTTTTDNKLLWQRSADVSTNALSLKRLNIVFGGTVSSVCNSVRVPVVATVTTPPTLALSSNTATICSGQTTTPITVTTGAADYDTYTFLPAGGVSGTVGTGFSFNPTTTTTYTLTASQSTGSFCTTTQTITITVNPIPSAITIAPTSATTCANNVQALTATGGTIGSSGSTTIGTATTLTTANGTEPTAFNNRYEHYWMQMVFTQAELSAAGIQAGNINSIKFNITTIGSAANVTDLRIFMGSTSQSVLTGFTTTGISEVFSAATYTHAIGINTLTFSTPYNWDGVSNIIVDMRSTGVDLANNSETYYTATTDNKTVSSITSTTFTSSNAYVASNPAGTLSLKRLNTTFDWSSVQTNPITWSPTTNLFTDALATIPYTGTAATTVYHMATGATAATTYTATATSAATCTNSATTIITVNAATAAPTATSPQSLNAPATIANIVITGAGTIIWYPTNNDALANTNPLNSTTTLVNNTTYYATQTIGGCPSAPIAVLVNVVLRNNSFDMNSLEYYPNPVMDMLNISYTNTISSIEVFNLLGQVVKSTKPNQLTTQLDMSGLPTATYLVQVTSEGKTATIKVVKK